MVYFYKMERLSMKSQALELVLACASLDIGFKGPGLVDIQI